jgi:hypothetical protein
MYNTVVWINSYRGIPKSFVTHGAVPVFVDDNPSVAPPIRVSFSLGISEEQLGFHVGPLDAPEPALDLAQAHHRVRIADAAAEV